MVTGGRERSPMELVEAWNAQLRWFAQHASPERAFEFTMGGVSLDEMIRRVQWDRFGVTADREALAAQMRPWVVAERTRAEMVEEFRPQLELLGLLRSDSTHGSAVRRLKEFIAEYVIPTIPEDDLPARVRVGRQSGALRRGAGAGTSETPRRRGGDRRRMR